MMIYPPIAELVEKTGSRYVLVIEAARRARQLSEGASPLCSCDSTKEVSIATNEIYQDKLGFYAKAVVEPEENLAQTEANLQQQEASAEDLPAMETESTDDFDIAFESGESAEHEEF